MRTWFMVLYWHKLRRTESLLVQKHPILALQELKEQYPDDQIELAWWKDLTDDLHDDVDGELNRVVTVAIRDNGGEL